MRGTRRLLPIVTALAVVGPQLMPGAMYAQSGTGMPAPSDWHGLADPTSGDSCRETFTRSVSPGWGVSEFPGTPVWEALSSGASVNDSHGLLAPTADVAIDLSLSLPFELLLDFELREEPGFDGLPGFELWAEDDPLGGFWLIGLWQVGSEGEMYAMGPEAWDYGPLPFVLTSETPYRLRTVVTTTGVDLTLWPAADDEPPPQVSVADAIVSGAGRLEFNWVYGGDGGIVAMDSIEIAQGLACEAGPGLPAAQVLGGASDVHGNKPVRFEVDPVNTATGNFVMQTTDLALPGRGLGFAFTRTYNSLDTTSTTVLGHGWTHSYAVRLDADLPDGSVRLYAGDGGQMVYLPDGSGGYHAPPGAFSVLSELPGGGYALIRRDQGRYEFDADGALTANSDRNGNKVTFAYTFGELTTITDSVGRTITLGYDEGGRLVEVVLPDARSVTYSYTGGLLTSVTDLAGETTTYTHDAADRLASIIDANGHAVVTNEYEADGRVSAQTNATGDRGTFAWDPQTETSTYTDAHGGSWTDVYARNVLQSTTDALGNITSYTYDADFNLSAVTDPRGHITTLGYDDRGNLTSRSAPIPLGHAESWTYTARNDVATHTDGRDAITEFEYDPAGNLFEVRAPLGATTTFTRDPLGSGLLISTTDPRAKTTTYGYDVDGNQTSLTTPLGHETTMAYDAAGRLIELVDPRGNAPGATPADYATIFTYDGANRLLSTTDPLTNTTNWTYDPAGNPTSVTDANSNTTTWAHDEANRLTAVTDAADEVTAYEYDATGNLVSRTDANDHVTTYAYDLANRLTSASDPLANDWTLTYDAAGNLATSTDAMAHTTTFSHDALNRLVTIDYTDAATHDVTYAYDAASNRVAMTDGAGTESYAFDALNRLTSVTRGSDTFGYGYDPAGNLTSRSYPGQAAQTWAHDDDGRLSAANGATYAYDPAGNLATAVTSDGYTARHTYDRAGRLLEVAHRTDTDLLNRFTYQIDAAGNRTAMTTREGTVSYRYDDLNRLTGACWVVVCPWGVGAAPAPCLDCAAALPVVRPLDSDPPHALDTFVNYTYDPVGNRLSEETHLGTAIYLYDDADRLTSLTPPDANPIAYSFDANGNQTAAGADTFAYDAADRLVSATVGGTSETYTYAGDGRRLSATSGASSTQYVWDQAFGLPQLALERDGAGGLLRAYRYGLDLLSQSTGASTAWYHHDGLGSVVDVTDSTGSSLAWGEYYPYGKIRLAASALGAPTVEPFAFTGEQLDPLSGLYHLRARQYDPATGRFLSTDPVAMPISDPHVSSYVYVGQQPTRYTDPSGKCFGPLVFLAPACVAAAAGAIGGAVTYVGSTVIVNALGGEEDLSKGLTAGDLAVSTVGGAVTGGLFSKSVGLTTLGRAVFGGGAGAGTTVASQLVNGRDIDALEIGLGTAFGAGGAVINFGAGAIGTFRGLVAGGGMSVAQSLLSELLSSMGGPRRVNGSGGK